LGNYYFDVKFDLDSKIPPPEGNDSRPFPERLKDPRPLSKPLSGELGVCAFSPGRIALPPRVRSINPPPTLEEET
jgi:hypothetical protein